MIPDYMFPFANHLWQSTLFAIAVWLMTLALRKNRAAIRHGLWFTASVKFLVPFSLLASIGSQFRWDTPWVAPPVRVSVFVETISQPFSASSGESVGPPATATAPGDSRFAAVVIVVMGVWICGVAASLLLWSVGWRRVHRAVRRATPANLIGPLRVMYSRERFEPGVFGIFNPVLLLPEGIPHHLSPAQLEAVLAHELCHVRRRDNLAMATHMIVEALFWFHPLVWWIRLRLVEEQELACDEEVLRLGTEPAVYAESLLKVCEFSVRLPLTCASGVTARNLRKRVGRIVLNRIGENLNTWRKITLASAGVAALATPVLLGIVNATPMLTQVSQSPSLPAVVQQSVAPTPRPVVAARAVSPSSSAAVSQNAQEQDRELSKLIMGGRAKSAAAPDEERAMEQAFRSGETATDLRFQAEANYFQLNRAEYFVPITLKIPNTQFQSAGRIFFDILGEVTDDYGTTIVNLRDAVDVRLPDETARERPMGKSYMTRDSRSFPAGTP